MKEETLSAVEDIAKKEGIHVNSSLFGDKENSTTEKDISVQNEDIEADKQVETIDEKLAALKMTKDDLSNIIIELADSGSIKRTENLLQGKLPYTFETKTLSYSREYLKFFESADIDSQALVEYYMNLYSVASILSVYNGAELPDEISDRVKWIEGEVAGPIYGILLKKSRDFHAMLELLVSTEVEDFL